MKQSTFFTFVIGTNSYSIDITQELEEHQRQNMILIPKTPKHIFCITKVKDKIMSIIESKQRDIIYIESLNSEILTVFESKNYCRKSIHTLTINTAENILKANKLELKPSNQDNRYKTNPKVGDISQKDCFMLMANFIAHEVSEFENMQ